MLLKTYNRRLPADPARWEELGESPSWYLDPLVARQKRDAHQSLVRRWSRGLKVQRALKTDLFEEAHGDDQILFDLFPDAALVLGIDVAVTTVRRACARLGDRAGCYIASDARRLAFETGSVDVIISNSTLDHFDTAEDFEAAVGELARVLRPGGALIITVDNPHNPLYPLLKWTSRRGWTPFLLGYTPTGGALQRCLRQSGLEVTDLATLLHNPRMVSTLVFLGLRRFLGRYADPMVALLLRLFAAMERLPTRRLTACFLAACARKPLQGEAKATEPAGR